MHSPAPPRAAIQRRTLQTLSLGVVPSGIGVAGSVAGAALLGEELTGSASLGTLAASCLTVGAALATVPLAQRMSRSGRRPGLVRAWGLASLGAALVFTAAVTGAYPLMLVGMTLIGVGQAAGLAARFAAADLAEDDDRARAISLVVWASSVGAVLGPSLALGVVGRLATGVGLPALSGPFLMASVVFAGGTVFVHRRLRPDPLQEAGGLRPAVPTSGPMAALRERLSEAGAPLRAVLREPSARLAATGMLVGQAVMVAVMTATPLHMRSGAHELQVVGFVISLHIVGMYAFAPLVGWLVDRVGPRLVIGAAGVVLFVGGELASHTRAEDAVGVFVGLFLIGLGWSFGLIAGSALLTASFPAAQRVGVQGAADLLMSGAGAVAGLSAGVVYELSSYADLSHLAGLGALSMTAYAGASLVATTRRRRPA